MNRAVTARAGTNIALVKYWGKRDAALNLPAAGSLSLTLAELGTETRVEFAPGLDNDEVMLGGAAAEAKFASRVSGFLDLVRARAGITQRARVQTTNTVPTAAGLASSASGFAALALAASRAAGLSLTPSALSALARRGSGSAARSVFGGLVVMDAGQRADGEDACASPLLAPDAWDLRLVVAITARGEKAIGSTAAMDHTAATSPYYRAWIDSVPGDLAAAQAAIAARDLPALGVVVERSALRMHASAIAADPAILYWSPATVAALHAVANARAKTGLRAYATIDAGPHVKVLCRAPDVEAVAALLRETAGVLNVLVASPGPAAAVIDG
ncbi:MAG TPA: diphosphomevalonate decarboxylase [Polyangia bacterium]